MEHHKELVEISTRKCGTFNNIRIITTLFQFLNIFVYLFVDFCSILM